MKPIHRVSLLSLSIALNACGGGDNNNKGMTDDTVFPVEAGRLVDVPVANLMYQTATQKGVTTADGEFNYRSGETITFFIGDIEVASALTDEAIALSTLFGDVATQDTHALTHEAINYSLLLHSLDTDSDPANGIQISDFTHQVIKDSNVTVFNFDQTAADFSADITPLMAEIGTNSGEVANIERVLAYLHASIAAIPADTDLDGLLDYQDPFVDDPSSIGIDACIPNQERYAIISGSANLQMDQTAWVGFGLTLNNVIGLEGNDLLVGPVNEQHDLLDIPAGNNFSPEMPFELPINTPTYRYLESVSAARFAQPTDFRFAADDIEGSAEGHIGLSSVFRFTVDPTLGGGQLLLGDFTLSYETDSGMWYLSNNINISTKAFSIGNAVLSTTNDGFQLNGELLGSAELGLLIPQSTGVSFGSVHLTARCVD